MLMESGLRVSGKAVPMDVKIEAMQKEKWCQPTARVRIVFTASSSTLPYGVPAEVAMADIEKEEFLVSKVSCSTDNVGLWQDTVTKKGAVKYTKKLMLHLQWKDWPSGRGRPRSRGLVLVLPPI
jgi:hypothetical protein